MTRWGGTAGLDETLLLDLRLLVTEVVTNAVRHAQLDEDAQLDLDVERDGERVRVQLLDGGAGFDEFLPIPEADAASGRGLYVVHQLASSWGVDPGPPFGIWFELERR